MARSAPVRCVGFVVRLGTDALPVDAAGALAESVVARTLGDNWTDGPLSRDERTRLVRRHDGKAVPLPAAWPKLRRLRADRDVASAELDLVQPGVDGAGALPSVWRVRPASFGAGAEHLDSSAPRRWSLDLCRVPDAWALPPDGGRPFGEGVLIGHPDTGFTRHPEIVRPAGGVRPDLACDFVETEGDGTDPLDGDFLDFPGHGTGTASVLVADRDRHPDVSDVTGVAPGAELVPLRVSDSVVHLNFARVIAAIEYATDVGCHVISMSLGGPFPSAELKRVVRRAVDQGVIVFAAAGNYWPFVVYPARLPDVIAVAACNADERAWRFSAQGREVDVTGPGESVWTANASRYAARPFGEGRSSGTSHATATVAGICALWLAHHGRGRLIARYGRENLAAVFKEVLMRDGVRRPAGIDWEGGGFGAGLVDADALLRASLPDTPPAVGLARLAATSTSDRPPGVLGEIARLVPSVPADRLRVRLCKLLGATEIELPGLLHEHGEELALLVALDPATRRALGEGAVRAAKVATPRRVLLETLAGRIVSRRLGRRLMAGGPSSTRTPK